MARRVKLSRKASRNLKDFEKTRRGLTWHRISGAVEANDRGCGRHGEGNQCRKVFRLVLAVKMQKKVGPVLEEKRGRALIEKDEKYELTGSFTQTRYGARGAHAQSKWGERLYKKKKEMRGKRKFRGQEGGDIKNGSSNRGLQLARKTITIARTLATGDLVMKKEKPLREMNARTRNTIQRKTVAVRKHHRAKEKGQAITVQHNFISKVGSSKTRDD